MSRHGSNSPPELRERAVRMVAEVKGDYPSEWAAIAAEAPEHPPGTHEERRPRSFIASLATASGQLSAPATAHSRAKLATRTPKRPLVGQLGRRRNCLGNMGIPLAHSNL